MSSLINRNIEVQGLIRSARVEDVAERCEMIGQVDKVLFRFDLDHNLTNAAYVLFSSESDVDEACSRFEQKSVQMQTS